MTIGLLTRQIEEVGVLMEFVEYSARPVLCLRGSQYSNGILGELCGKRCAALCVFKSCDTGGN